MYRDFLHALVDTLALAWTEPRFGCVPGNDFGVPQNASYDYAIIGEG
jgi:choline dehydrogenase